MGRIIILLSVIAISCAGAFAQTIDPTVILRKADSACRLVRTARYSASVRSGVVTGEQFKTSGIVVLRRLDATDPLGVAVRAERSDGLVYAYDGDTLRILNPHDKTLTFGTPSENATAFVAGNGVIQLVKTGLIRDSLFFQLANQTTALHYRRIEQVNGIRCHVIDVAEGDNQVVKNINSTWWIGVNDHLPRKLVNTFTFNNNRQEQSTVLSDLRVNEELPSDIFSLVAPDGYVKKYMVLRNHRRLPK